MESRKTTKDFKAKAAAVLTLDFMSSEEERDDNFEIRPLRWRSQACDELFKELDETGKTLMTSKARRQTSIRTMGPFSSRASPQVEPQIRWAVKK